MHFGPEGAHARAARARRELLEEQAAKHHGVVQAEENQRPGPDGPGGDHTDQPERRGKGVGEDQQELGGPGDGQPAGGQKEQRGEYEEILKDVEEGIKRVQNIVSDLRTFTHPDAEQCDQVEVADVVNAALRFLSGEWRDKVRIEHTLAGHQTIWANRNKLVHVMVNLLQNSLDALRRKKFDGGQPTIWLEGRVENNRSLIVVRDNGTGIDAEDLNKIFDPFFTTKDVGEGMGLGLSICYRIVRQYDGRISVKSERGKFCEFTLEFPVKGQPAISSEQHHGKFAQL